MKIAVVICGLVFDSQKALMKGVERRVRDLGDVCSVFCVHVNVSGNNAYTKGEYMIFRLPDFSSFDAIVYVRNTIQNTVDDGILMEKLAAAGKPVVCIDGFSDRFVNIMSDERAGMQTITEHLITEHGCRKLYFLGGQTTNNDTVERFAGFQDALLKYKVPFKEAWRIDGNFEYSSGVTAASYFLKLPDGLPDAIVCANDEMAVGLITEFKKQGVKVPLDVRVTGTDYDSVSRVFNPKLTTVKRQQYQKGANAINILHEYENYKPGQVVGLPITLFVGETCGCKACEENRADINALAIDRYLQSELVQQSKKMSADLMAVKNRQTFIREVEKYAEILNPEELYLCLNDRDAVEIDYSDYAEAINQIDRNNQEEYAEFVECVIAYRRDSQGRIGVVERFLREKLLPPSANGGREGVTYYYFPIHYQNRNFGYAVLGGSGEMIRNDFFPNWATTVSNAFENTRKRVVMEQMISALDRMWIYDTLTGIYNRAGFFKLSETIVNECINENAPVCVIFMDVDGLKEVNDKYGHDEGDCLIKDIAQIIKEQKRHGEILMRYGGDEFVLMAAGYDDKAAKDCIERIEEAMRVHNEKSHKPYEISASAGYYITKIQTKDELNNIIEEADHEMYKKKYVKKALRRKAEE